MSNKEIINLLKLAADLMELHAYNTFKIKSVQNAAFALEKVSQYLVEMKESELAQIEGIGKSIAGYLHEIVQTGSFDELNKLSRETPPGVVEMLGISGIGVKKVRSLWKELNLETLQDLYQACQQNQVASLKGFGEKTQKGILEELDYKLENAQFRHYAVAEPVALAIYEDLKKLLPKCEVAISGQIRRKCEVVDQLTFVAGSENPLLLHEKLHQLENVEAQPEQSGPFKWAGLAKQENLPVAIHLCEQAGFPSLLLKTSASVQHLSYPVTEDDNLLSIISQGTFASEEAIYQSIDQPVVPPELREGIFEFKEGGIPDHLLEVKELKGILHNHSTYSDGKNTLAEMAEACQSMGYEYLGISDHSRSAFYANGLEAEMVQKQHEEIDALNKKMAPFKIFKGIESDILPDGSLDYEDEVLAGFDFIVASIHSGLKMDAEKATQRLIKAIENPYTTILGHMTGRLLLRRKGYPVDHQKVIDACAANKVVIEINANPWRLDMDWRWVHYALEKEVMLSINPDAHEVGGYDDMYYGVCVGRKGGLTAKQTLNAMSLKEIDEYFQAVKKQKQLA